MSRRPAEISDADQRKLARARERVDKVQAVVHEREAELRQVVREVLASSGSIRTVAAFLDVNPSTIQAWAKEDV